MFYRELAEKFDDLFILSDIINRLQSADRPLKELKRENFIASEIERIKSAAFIAFTVFGSEYDKYHYFHVNSVNYLTITVNEKIRELSGKLCPDEREQYQLMHFEGLRPCLEKLIKFYTAIYLSITK